MSYSLLTENYVKSLEKLLKKVPGNPLSAEEEIKIRARINSIKTKQDDKRSESIFEKFSSEQNGGYTEDEQAILDQANRIREKKNIRI